MLPIEEPRESVDTNTAAFAPTAFDNLREIANSMVAALNRLLAGDSEPFKALFSHGEDVAIMSAFGSYGRGWEAVADTLDTVASHFRGGEPLRVEPLAAGISGSVGYLVWIERALVRVEGRDDAVSMELRTTHIMHREDGGWKLLHRHADPLVESTEVAAV